MRIKSYFAPSVQEAMEKARVDLGPEAMLISSKKTGSEARGLASYEVVFGLSPNAAPSVANAWETPAPKQVATQSQTSSFAASSFTDSRLGAPARRTETRENPDLARELAELRKQIESVRRSVSRPAYSRALDGHRTPEFAALYDLLADADFSDEIAHELVESVASNVSRNTHGSLDSYGHSETSPEIHYAALRETIEQRIHAAPQLGHTSLDRQVVAFVGPSGAGKTTSLVKLAVKYGIARRTPVQILSADSLRVGGSEQLGAYARIIGAGFRSVPTTAALDLALAEIAGKKLVLIDTPGYSAAEMKEAAEWRAFLNHHPQIEVQMVLPAVLRPTALVSILDRCAAFEPSKLLLTHLDDAPAPGSAIEAAIRSKLPISFLSTGQQIPEDIEEASVARLADKLFEREGGLGRNDEGRASRLGESRRNWTSETSGKPVRDGSGSRAAYFAA